MSGPDRDPLQGAGPGFSDKLSPRNPTERLGETPILSTPSSSRKVARHLLPTTKTIAPELDEEESRPALTRRIVHRVKLREMENEAIKKPKFHERNEETNDTAVSRAEGSYKQPKTRFIK